MFFYYIKLLRLRLLCSSVGMPDKRNFMFIYFSWLPTSFKFHWFEKAHWLVSLSLLILRVLKTCKWCKIKSQI